MSRPFFRTLFTIASSISFRSARTTYNSLNKRDLAFIQAAVEASRAAHKIIVTHHVPSSLLMAPEFRGSSLERGLRLT